MTTPEPVELPGLDGLSQRQREAFVRELRALEAEAVASLGPDDLAHMKKLERWGRWCTAAGYATAWAFPNPLSMALLSTGSMARWAIVAHHVLHKGMDRVPEAPERLTSRGFAAGRRRLVDWFDWFIPEAWHHEHDVLHHGHTNEEHDPDLVELNVEAIRDANIPRALKLAAVAAYACTWKLSYYAPHTLQVLQRKRRRRAAKTGTLTDDARGPERYVSAYDPRTADGRELWKRSILPYGLARFVALPALFAPLGPLAVASVALNSLGAELLTNIHTFVIIAPNHAGEDLHRFTGRPRDRALHDRRRRERLPPRLPQLPDRAPPLSGPAAVEVPVAPATRACRVREAWRAVPAGVRARPTEEARRRRRRRCEHARRLAQNGQAPGRVTQRPPEHVAKSVQQAFG